MTNQPIAPADRARLRRRFPRPAPDVSAMDFMALANWQTECERQRRLSSAWTLDGFRWRRAAKRVTDEYAARLLAHTGMAPGLCDVCQTRPANVHVAYESREAPRFAHYCDRCESDNMPLGWMSIAVATVMSREAHATTHSSRAPAQR